MPVTQILKRLAFTLVPGLVLLIGLEAGLRLCGFVYNPHDLRRPMFTFVRSTPKRWVTANYYRQSDYLRLISGRTDEPMPVGFVRDQSFQAIKRNGALRVALVGGSTVHDLGTAEPLQQALERELLRPISIVNMGMPGTGSAREVATVQEAIGVSADAIIYYTGHNEFGDLSRRRSYRQLPLGMRPLYRDWRTAQLAWWLGHRWKTPVNAGKFMGLDESYDLAALRDLAMMRSYNAAAREKALEDFECNVRAIAKQAADAQVRLFICSAPYNLRLPAWSKTAPVLFEHLTDRSLVAMAELDDEDSSAAATLLAQRLLQQGQTDAAREQFERALVVTRKPTRATRETNAILAQVATETGTPQIDLKSAIDALAPDGLPGSDVFADQCHLYPAGNQRLLETMAAAMAPALRN